MTSRHLIIRQFDQAQAYVPIWQNMQEFTQKRQADTPDELWLLEHEPVFTQGQAGKPEHILNLHDIPIVLTDRGGQISYHAPGQLLAYCLLDMKRLQLGIRQLVTRLEQLVIQILASLDISAHSRIDAPGVYVAQQKICSIGLRVRRGCSYHGIALNYHMDLTPFTYINPCGYAGLTMTQISNFNHSWTFKHLQQQFITAFCQVFDYNDSSIIPS